MGKVSYNRLLIYVSGISRSILLISTGEALLEYERNIKIPLFPDCSFLVQIPRFPFALGFPSDELHFLVLGVFGDHLMSAIIHR